MALDKAATGPTSGHVTQREDVEGWQTSGTARRPSVNGTVPPKHVPALHRFEHTKSILAVVVHDAVLYAGTQGGEILVYGLQTFQRLNVVEAHDGAVLGLCLTQTGAMLLSSAGDRRVNVWETGTMTLLASLYSNFDIGDVFCVAWSPSLRTIYLGSQNTSVQWYSFKDYDPQQPSLQNHTQQYPPSTFFPPSESSELEKSRQHNSLMIKNGSVHRFAHHGYVYCMLLLGGGEHGQLHSDTLITGGGDGVIKLWSLDKENGGRPHERLNLDDGKDLGDPVLSIALDGTFLYGARGDGMINVWDLATRQLLRTIDTRIREDVLTLSVGGGYLYAGLVDGSIMTFNQRHELVKQWKGHNGRVLSSCFVHDLDRAVYITGSNDNSLAIWNGNSGKIATPAVRTGRVQLRDSLSDFVAFRSVSSDPGCAIACRSAANYLRGLLDDFGAITQTLPNSGGFNPVVYALFGGNTKCQARRERVIFYGHYDVIAAENKSQHWKSDPFELNGRGDHLYGRGVSDNKGPIIASIFAVAELASQGRLACDVVFLLEGEEETGSRGFQSTVRDHKELIGPVDWILLANSYWINDEVPCLTYGLRGILRVTLKVESDEPDLHSGVDGSKLMDEPMKDLVLLLSKLSGRNGRIEIPGFYDNIPEVTKDELELYHEVSEVLLARDPNLCGGDPEAVTASLMGRWREANLTIHGISSSGPSNSTIISKRAQATLSMRLVPQQEVQRIWTALESYLESIFTGLESKNQFTITVDHVAEPWLGVRTNKLFKTLERAVTEVWDLHSRDVKDVSQQPRTSTHPAIHSRRRTLSSAKISLQSPLRNSPLLPQVNPDGSEATRPRRQSTTKTQAPTSSTLTSAPSPLTASFPIQQSPVVTSNPASRRKLLYIREGGSIPAIRFLEKEFDAQTAHLPCGQASDAAHLDNERLRVVNLYKAKDVFEKVFASLE